MRPVRRRPPSAAMGVALLALFIALGGSSYATLHREGDQEATAAQATSTIARSTFKDSFTLTTGANQLVTVARLRLPAGRYVVFAKLYTGLPEQGLTDQVRCDLHAGDDFDRTVVNHDGITPHTTVALNVVHRFSETGAVVLRCGHETASGTTLLRFIKITAIRVRSLVNLPSP